MGNHFVRWNSPIITNLLPHQGNTRLAVARGSRGGAAVDPRLAFHALQGRQGVRIGEGGLSATHTATIYAPDANGVYRPFAANEPVWEGVDWLKYQPAATNASPKNSRDYSGWLTAGGAPTRTSVEGIDGVSGSATKVDGIGMGVGVQVYETGLGSTAGVEPVVFVIYVKKTTGASVFPRIRAQFQTPVTYTDIEINTNTGELTEYAGSGSADNFECIGVGEWWRVMVQRTTVGVSDTAFVIMPMNGANEWDGYHTFIKKTIAEVRGLGPIFTTTAAASTDRTAYSFDMANQNNALGAWFMEVVQFVGAGDPEPGAAWWDENLLQFGSAHGINLYPNAVPMLSYRTQPAGGGNGNTGGNQTIHRAVPGVAEKWGASYSGGEALAGHRYSTKADPGWSETTGTFHSLGHETGLTLGKVTPNQLAVPYMLRNLRRYNVSDYAEGKAIIDGLMA